MKLVKMSSSNFAKMESSEKFPEITAEIESHSKVIEVVWMKDIPAFSLDPRCFEKDFREFIHREHGAQEAINMFLRGYYVRDKFENHDERRKRSRPFYEKFGDDYHFYKSHNILRKANVLAFTVRQIRRLVEYYLGENKEDLKKLADEIPAQPESIREKEMENVRDLEIEHALSVRAAIIEIMEGLSVRSADDPENT